MRYAIVVLMLVGWAVGQGVLVGPGSNTFPANREQCLQAVAKHWISPDMCSVYGPHGAKPGDCYRVKQDGTLEKVKACGNTMAELPTSLFLTGPAEMDSGINQGSPRGVGTRTYPSDLVDIPAGKVPIPKEEQTQCGPSSCDMRTSSCLAVCNPPETERWGCADKSRILLTAEDGTHWCHAPQPTTQH